MQIAHSSLRATHGLAGAATTELCSLGRFKRAGVGGNCVSPFAEAAGVSVNCSIAHDLGIDNVSFVPFSKSISWKVAANSSAGSNRSLTHGQ